LVQAAILCEKLIKRNLLFLKDAEEAIEVIAWESTLWFVLFDRNAQQTLNTLKTHRAAQSVH